MINLASLIEVRTDEAWNCGQISFTLEDEKYKALIEVDNYGSVYIDPMSPEADQESWEGLHQITFMAFFHEIDPD